MRFRGLVALLVVLAALAAGGYYARHRLRQAAAPAQPVYATAKVTQGPLIADVLGFGPLQPNFLAAMQSPTAGTVEQVFVQQGQTVHKGEVLAKLSNPSLQTKIGQDQVTVQKDLAALAAALGTTPAKAMATVDTGGVPVPAPQAGRVVQWDVKVGDAVNQGDALASIVDDSKVVMDVGLVPYDYKRAAVGDQVSVRFDQFDGSVAGILTSLSSNPTPGSSGFTYPAVITLTNPGLLAPKMKGSVVIHAAGGDLPLPAEASITGYGYSTVVNSPIAGTVQSLAVQQNGWVDQNQILCVLGGSAAVTAVDQLRAQVQTDQTQLQQDQDTLKQLTVTSDLNGTVGYLYIRPGQQVGNGQPLGEVFNSKSMNLTIQVSELQVARVQAGQAVIITTPGLPGKTFDGHVTSVDTIGNNRNGLATFGVQIAVDTASGLRPGMTADARIVVQSVQNAVRVPVEAVVQNGTQAEVEILGADGRPAAVPVTVGVVNDQYAQITKGLTVGQTVITGMAGQSLPGLGQAASGTATSSGAATAAGAGGPVAAKGPPVVVRGPVARKG